MNTPNPIVVVAHWRLAEQDVAEVLSLIDGLRTSSLAEPGCLGYDVFQGVSARHELLLVERYRDDAAIEAHRGTPHYREIVVERIVPRLKERRVELLQARTPG